MFTGIISGVGRIGDAQPLGSDAYGRRLTIETPAGYLDDVALGDSIALNGACMTVTPVKDSAAGGEFSINLIPHTVANTTLGTLTEGASVNLEIDTIARYVERMLGVASPAVDGQPRL